MREIFSKAAKILFFSSKKLYQLLILISLLPSVSCFDIDISPKEICCGDQITATISITNSNAVVTIEGHIELEIVDANGNRNPLDELNGIVLQPGESEDFETRIRPDDCTSFGKYEVIANFVGDNCYLWKTASSKFIVSDCHEPEPKPRSGCTDKYGCKNNIVRRLCRDKNGDEYWKTVDDCNDYDPPRECINGKCVEMTPLCDQDECEERSGPAGEPYLKNGALYQEYKDCDCVSNSCQCKQVEKKVPCTGIISGGVIDKDGGMPISDATVSIQDMGEIWWEGRTDANGAFKSYLKVSEFRLNRQFCPLETFDIIAEKEGYKPNKRSITTDSKGNCIVTLSLTAEAPECSGVFSGYIKDVRTGLPIPGSSLLICQNGEECWSPPPVDSTGLYSTGERGCPSTTYEITCSAEGYKSETGTVTTDNRGNARQDFSLESECSGKISGHVSDANTKSPISGAVLLICKQDEDCWSTSPVDSIGVYNTEEMVCPSTTYDITCSAEGYKSKSITVATDERGIAWKDFPLERDCQGTVSGKVLDASNDQPITGANLLICQNEECFDPIITDASGQFSLSGLSPSASYDITCSAEGYETREEKGITKDDGSSLHEIQLEPEQQGTISGRVLDAKIGTPIKGAAFQIYQNSYLLANPTDKEGYFSAMHSSPLALTTIMCSADGYVPSTKIGTTDEMGDLKEQDFSLVPLPSICQGSTSDLSITEIKSAEEIGMGQELDVEITLKNIGNKEFIDTIPIVFKLADDKSKNLPHTLNTILGKDLSYGRYDILQSHMVNKNLNLKPGQTITVKTRFLVSDDLYKNCIFTNTLIGEIGLNNFEYKEIRIHMGTNAKYCLNIGLMQAIGLAIGSVVPGGNHALEVSLAMQETLLEEQQDIVKAIENGDTKAAAIKIIKLSNDVQNLIPGDMPLTPDKLNIKEKFIINYIKGIIDFVKCTSDSSVLLLRLGDDLQNEMITQGMTMAVEVIKDLTKKT